MLLRRLCTCGVSPDRASGGQAYADPSTSSKQEGGGRCGRSSEARQQHSSKEEEEGGVSAGVEKDQGGVGAGEYDDKAKGEVAGESAGLSPKLGLSRF